MQLRIVRATSIGMEPVESITGGVIYFVSTGRNAWHGTWSQRYSADCMYTLLGFAKAYAERKRAPGTVFEIEQLPCLVVRSSVETLLITEINSKNPLSAYSINPDWESLPHVLSKRDIGVKYGVPLRVAATTFNTYSSFWKTRPKLNDSVVMLSARDPELSIEKFKRRGLTAIRSKAVGVNYFLDWHEFASGITKRGVLKLIRTLSEDHESKQNNG